MITAANPIYDIVFKYLIEDERIARTILSALLKKEVVAVETRRNEYSNIGRYREFLPSEQPFAYSQNTFRL